MLLIMTLKVHHYLFSGVFFLSFEYEKDGLFFVIINSKIEKEKNENVS